MRKFYLENKTGDKLPLQGGNVFLHKPRGLGYGDELEYFQSEYGFHTRTNREAAQANIVGDLVFSGDAYAGYAEFVDWVSAAEELKLVYLPMAGRELVMDVDIERQGLSEIAPYGVLETPVSFRGRSPFYLREPIAKTIESNSVSDNKRYRYARPYVYSQSGAANAAEINADGHFPAALEVWVNGPVSRPVIAAEDMETGREIGRVDLSGVSLKEGEKLYYSSRPNAMEVCKITENGREDLMGYVNINDNNFFALPTGRPVQVTLAVDVDAGYEKPISHQICVYEYFRG